MLAHQLPVQWTYRDYQRWEGRWELIDGLAYNMPPSPNQEHQEIVGDLFNQFYSGLKGKSCKAFVAPFDVLMPQGNETAGNVRTVVQPDIVIVCDKTKLDGKRCKGAPDLVVEVVSPSTARRDVKDKLRLYETAGVQEYWIVYPEQRNVWVFSQQPGGGYGRPDTYGEGDQIGVGVFPELTIDLTTVFPGEPVSAAAENPEQA